MSKQRETQATTFGNKSKKEEWEEKEEEEDKTKSDTILDGSRTWPYSTFSNLASIEHFGRKDDEHVVPSIFSLHFLITSQLLMAFFIE